VDEWGRFGRVRFGMFVFAEDGVSWQGPVRAVEDSGFDVVWTGDHLFHYARLDQPFLDGWASLAAWTQVTKTVRLGMLATNVSWRMPVQLARFAVAVDQLSGGRLELGLGAGAFADQAMAGVLQMPAQERVERLDEAALVLDRLLRGDCAPFSGAFTSYTQAAVAPGTLQRPRVPLTVAANGPRALAVVARRADVWNTWSGDAGSLREYREQVVHRLEVLRKALDTAGRDPATLRLSLTVYHRVFDVWANASALEEMAAMFVPLGFSEFVVYPPREDQQAIYRQVTGTRMPQLQ
jgi:alkanesulfonate monooxygenase SsuD/methylene tetrahydromethanopterin reductase-like flavin-dependent oxidoreductase (luciferase family)